MPLPSRSAPILLRPILLNIVVLVCSPHAFGALAPFAADSSTLHLWHLDETAAPCVDAAPGGTNLTALVSGAVLDSLSFAGFGNALNTIDGGQDQFGATNSDAVLTARGVGLSAAVQYCDAATGAFTYEAIVQIHFNPAKNFGPVSQSGNGRNASFQILNADGNANSQRIFELRLDPIGVEAFTGDTTSNAVRLEFINLVQGGSVQNILTPLPTTGPDAIVSNNWYHVAVSYSGTPNLAGNIKFYWTLMDTNRTQATLLDGTKTMNSGLAGSANPTAFTIGNAGRNPGGIASNPLNANFCGRIDEVRISNIARPAAGMLFFPPGISITTQPTPTNQIIGTGQPLSYGVAATGQSLNYQWQHNGSPIASATSNSFSIPSAQIPDSGNYDVVITNSSGSVTSTVVSVTVTNLAITSQPASLVAGYASTCVFSVGAVGAQPLYYQWRKGGVPLNGASNSSLSLGPLVAADQGSYGVVVSNSFGSLTSATATLALGGPQVTLTSISDGTSTSGYGYAGSSAINAVAFIRSALMTVSNQQFVAFYGRHPTDPSYSFDNRIWIGRRTVGTNLWQIFQTMFAADDITDGHDVVCFGIDGEGYMHLSWGMHNAALNYCRSTNPVTGNLPIGFSTNSPMTGNEASVTYPQFLRMPNGDLLYLFRQGASGAGDNFLNRYVLATHSWTNVNYNGGQAPFIKGTWAPLPDYNAYLNMPCLDAAGNLSLVWTWRSTSAYQSNHDFDDAYSSDGGVTWRRADGSLYDLPISQNAESGEPATLGEKIISIPENSSLINQAGMCLDASNRAVIATWWAPGTPTNDFRRQYMVAFPDTNGVWQIRQVSNRTNDPPGTIFQDADVRDLGRPVIVADKANRLLVLYRDNFNSNGLTVAYTLPYALDPQRTNWNSVDLTTDNLGTYEPVIDLVRWEMDNVLDILYQASSGEGYNPPTNTASPIGVLEWNATAWFNHVPVLQLTLTNQNRDVELSWASQPGWGYQVQSSTNLVNWTTVTTLNGIPGLYPLQYVQTNGVSGPRRFWRLQTREGGFGP
jgi:hypothetical protein